MNTSQNKIVLFVFNLISCLYYGQSLNNEIIFENLSAENEVFVKKANNLLSKSKIYVLRDCSPNSGYYSDEKQLYKYCIEDIIVVYVYENKPILIDSKKLNMTRAYISDGSESSTTYIEKSRIYIKDWNNRKYFGKNLYINQSGNSINENPSMDYELIESIIQTD